VERTPRGSTISILWTIDVKFNNGRFGDFVPRAHEGHRAGNTISDERSSVSAESGIL
jgi:hypothetical protein